MRRQSERPQQRSLEPRAFSFSPKGLDIRCSNCKEHSYFVELEADTNNIFCTHCGHLTPKRQVRRTRGIVPPGIQQSTSLVQASEKERMRPTNRRPKSMVNDKPTDPTIQALGQRGGITIIDTQTNTIL